jgi:hypothetical protein
MPLVVKDRVRENSVTSGTGTITLTGAVLGFQTFSSAIGNGNTTYYAIAESGTANFEVGLGTVGAGTLTRDIVLESSNGGSLVNFGSAAKDVFCTYPAEKSFYLSINDLSIFPSSMFEKSTNSATAATGTVNFDVITQPVLYYTSNASANWTTNIRGSSSVSLDSIMATGQSMTIAFLVTQGATAYYNSAVTIDGNAITPKWQGGVAPTAGNASSIDIYTYTVIKTGSATFTVFASQTQFK